MRTNLIFLSIFLLAITSHTIGLIIPEELPTILSLIYSNIPPIKKGTDSRVGIGFRLGEHADFQVLVEIGPQKETEPIGNTDSKRRRQIMLESAMRGEYGPWAKSVAKLNLEKMIQQQKVKSAMNADVPKKENLDSNWLLKWSKAVSMPEGTDLPLGSSKIQKLRMNTGKNSK